MKYFDFHTHIILKQLFDEHPNIDAKVYSNDVPFIARDCTDLPYIIQSQIHQSQLAELNDEVIIGATLYGCESYLASAVKVLQKNLKPGAQHKMSLAKLDAIAAPDYKTFNTFTKGLTFDSFVNAPLSFNILTKESFSSDLPKNKVNIFFLIEGCHSLVNTINRVDDTHKYVPVEILANLDILLASAKVVGINITHMQQSSLCNHAFAMQIADFTHFIPLGNGFTDDGRKVVQGLFDRGISADLKHMSYKSRLDFRNDFDNGRYTNLQPPFCSHVGFTGISFSEWPGYIQNPKPFGDSVYIELVKPLQNNNSYFNPGVPAFNLSTINLFDEEIVWVVSKGGIIGLSLDRRILGYVGSNDDTPTGLRGDSEYYVNKEYISKQEWNSLGLSGVKTGSHLDDDNFVTASTAGDLEFNSTTNEYFSDHIILHIQHYFQVCYDAKIPIATAQKCITIGSDFDGFINPFINTQTVESISELKQYIKTNLGYCLKSSNDSKVWHHELDINTFIEDLFYNNGFNFIKQWFSK
jgi:microsomal dipeptidase-like Zn-dependent dipeptidase